MEVKVSDCEYADVISTFISANVPNININKNDLVDIITDILVGCKDIRYGSYPNVERLFHVRRVISKAIDSGEPIEIVVPWGSIKSNMTGDIDVAELSAITQLRTVAEHITKYYKPGVIMRFRIEDLSGYYMFGDIKANAEIDRYCESLVNLIGIMTPLNGYDMAMFKPILETSMPRANEFKELYESYVPLFYQYLFDTRKDEHLDTTYSHYDSYKKLLDIRWKGYISHEHREHYFQLYKQYYNDDYYQAIARLSRYFAQALARVNLQMTGKSDSLKDVIQINFTPPVKNAPENHFQTCLYFRTSKDARTQLAPWRSKGYLLINNRKVVTKITTFGNTDVTSTLIPSDILIKDTQFSVNIKSDYLLI